MRATFRRTGDVGRDLLAVDWDATPLGEPDRWPRSLQAAVRLVLTSRFPMWMGWGEDLVFFCNDAYRRDTLGAKYPWALGKPASVVWSEIWADISPRVDTVLSSGTATWDEELMLFLRRSGYDEETYHTFSYSPLAADDGSVAGLLCVVSEDTDKVIARRRMQTMRDLGQRSSGHPTVAETVATATTHLGRSDLDVPFSLIYLHGEDGDSAALVGATGFEDALPPDSPTTPWHPADTASPWDVRSAPTAEATTGGGRIVELPRREEGWPCGGWHQPPRQAAVVPIAQGAQAAPYGHLVVGLNPFRAVDPAYADFLDLVAGQLAAAITDARAFELEQRRAETLAELDRAKTDFFTNVSHEFRTPLTLLLGPAEDALEDRAAPLPEVQRDRVTAMHRNAQRLLKLVNTLLDFSRLESGRVEATFEPVDLARYTRELTSMFETAAARLGLELRAECDPLPRPVHVDRELWGKVVLNLLSNALKFTLSGSVTVRLRDGGDHAALSVIDTGTGIPAEEQPHLFERFRRVATTESRSHEGSGIGLALVAELAALHGGAVSVESTPGEGSAFDVRVPYGTDHLPADRLAEPGDRGLAQQVIDGFLSEATHLAAGATGSASPSVEGDTAAEPIASDDRPRVLVVDDNADIRSYVAQLLAPDYRVETAVDGEDGLRRAAAAPPDLVLTDVMMPRMTGFELLAALRSTDTTVDVPVVMLSARAGEDGTLEGLEAGADDYLVKPFAARELLARVRANLELDRARRSRERLERHQALLDQAQRLARLGSWEVDLATGQVHTSEQFHRIVGISEAEAELLRFPDVVDRFLHPDDRSPVRTSLESIDDDTSYEARVLRPDGSTALVRTHAEVVRDEAGAPALLRGYVQDITAQREAEDALAVARADAEVSAREHEIADELQRSLLPHPRFSLDHLDVATYYRAGVEGTQVGGDWYDVIELGGGRTALVIGDVMGRGVQAAAVMGQLRSAVRAYARLDLPPADLLEYLDGIVRDLGEDQIVTCLYAVFDPADLTLRFANAGHLPPLVVTPGEGSRLLSGEEEPPLGIGPYNLHEQCVQLRPGSTVVLYTDGLVERRGEDLEEGLHALTRVSVPTDGSLDDAPERLVHDRLPEGPDDDVAILIARVDAPEPTYHVVRELGEGHAAVAAARRLVTDQLRAAGAPTTLVDDAVLATSELVTNALVHAAAPYRLRVTGDHAEVRIEVHDDATYEPRKQRPDPDDEHGRGLQIVAALADRWGTRPTGDGGKAVWCVLVAGTGAEMAPSPAS